MNELRAFVALGLLRCVCIEVNGPVPFCVLSPVAEDLRLSDKDLSRCAICPRQRHGRHCFNLRGCDDGDPGATSEGAVYAWDARRNNHARSCTNTFDRG
jgi:hypothetical protein